MAGTTRHPECVASPIMGRNAIVQCMTVYVCIYVYVYLWYLRVRVLCWVEKYIASYLQGKPEIIKHEAT